MNSKFKLTKLEKSWILYDVGNSAFILLVSTLLPIYFNTLVEGTNVNGMAYWGYASSISALLVAIIAPICGTLADQSGFRKPLFLICLGLGALGCAALGGAWSWLSFLVVFVIAKVGYSSSIVFYDSMLPEVTGKDRMDKVSTMGYAYGYIGSVIPFILCLIPYIGSMLGFLPISEKNALIIGFFITAVWWIACSLPLSVKYRQRVYHPATGNPIAATFRQLADTVRDAKKHKHIFLYLLAFFFFIDGVYTIIDMATSYGKELGLDSIGLLLALLVTQFVAFPCSIIFGRLSAKYDTGLLLKVCIASYTFITLFAVFLVTQWQFWMLAVMVGMFQGGIQTLSRSYLGKIIPPDRSGEYFGLMDICGKGASILGTAMVGAVAQMTDGLSFSLFGLTIMNEGIAVGTLVILFAVGFLLFCKADKLTKARIKEEV